MVNFYQPRDQKSNVFNNIGLCVCLQCSNFC